MAAATLDHFPPDTKVEVWTKTGDSFDGGGRGKKVESTQVGTDGSLVLVGLKEDTEYWCVGDTGRVVDFIAADPEPRTGKGKGKSSRQGRARKPKGRAAQTSAGEGDKASSTPGKAAVKRPSGGGDPISATQQGGGGRSLSKHDEKKTGREGKATQRPKKVDTPGQTVRRGRKGVTGARGSRS